MQTHTPTRGEIFGFIFRTMLASIALAALCNLVIVTIVLGKPEAGLFIGALNIFGAVFVAPVMLLIWGGPSLGVFRVSLRWTRSFSQRRSFTIAALMTTFVAGLFLVVLTSGSRDSSGLMMLVALAALVCAPFTVRSSFPTVFGSEAT